MVTAGRGPLQGWWDGRQHTGLVPAESAAGDVGQGWGISTAQLDVPGSWELGRARAGRPQPALSLPARHCAG